MKVKQYYPFIVPTISLLLVLFLAFRWYNLRTQRNDIADVTQVEIENLSQDELMVVQGASDVSTVDLESEDGEPAVGQIRYKVDGERVLITVNADLPDSEGAAYQVWLSEAEKLPQPVFTLEKTKAGYLGSASIDLDRLPLELIITNQAEKTDNQMGEQLLKGMIEVAQEETQE